MAHSPPISPKVATPLAHRKRRHSAVDRGSVDLTRRDDDANRLAPSISPAKSAVSAPPGPVTDQPRETANVARKLEDDDDLDEDNEMLDDILDTAELEPYRPGFVEGDEGPSKHTISRLRSRLLRMGPERFIHETLEVSRIRPSLLGQAFGINPIFAEQLGEELFVRVLSAAIVRAYHKRRKLPEFNTIDDAAELLRKSNKIMVITGAGISTSLGIPDFRSKESGFYSKLLNKGYSEPEQVFDIEMFDEDPSFFYEMAADIIPDLKHFSPTHAFIRLLQDKGKLQTNYTQNIDNLEELAGIDKSRLIQCHGSFATATCRKCKHKVKGTDIFADIRAKRVAYCKRCIAALAAPQSQPQPPKPKKRRVDWSDSDSDDDADDDIPQPGVMKPDITFFGEALPDTFFTRFTDHDAKDVDLVLVIGTSMKVAPVSDMPNYLPHHVPHVYISREACRHVDFDVQLLGNCDDVVVELVRRAGWVLEHEMVEAGKEMRVEGVMDGDEGKGRGYWWRVGKEEGALNGADDEKETDGDGTAANGGS